MLGEKELFDSQRQAWLILRSNVLSFLIAIVYKHKVRSWFHITFATLLYTFPLLVHHHASKQLQNHEDSIPTANLYLFSGIRYYLHLPSFRCWWVTFGLPSFRCLWVVFGLLPSSFLVSYHQFFLSNPAIIPLLRLPF